MVKSKALSDPRRDRPLASQSRGVTKQKKRRDKEQEQGDAGVVGKKKHTYYTVLVGRNPAMIKDKEAYDQMCRAHPEAKSFSARHKRKVVAVIKDYQQRLEKEEKSAGRGTTHTGFIRFDTSDLPRGFALGRVRMNGKVIVSEAAKPTFSFSGQSAAARAEPSFPQHDDIEADKAKAQHLAAQAAAEAVADACEPAQVDFEAETSGSESDSESDEPVHENRHDASLNGHADQGGDEDVPEVVVAQEGLDADFIAFGSASESEDDAAPADEPAREAGAEAPTWRHDELPWYQSNIHIASQSARLHNEIVELTTLLRPAPAEDAQRIEAKDLLEGLIKGIFPTAKMEIFGSFATGLHLPTSDVDCVILCDEISKAGTVPALKAIGQALNRNDWATDVEVVANAKVPIVKLVVMPFGLKFDLSVGMGNGVHAVEYIRAALAAWPPLRPLVTVLKLFLLQRQMNEVFTGGLSSFSLILSVLAFLKIHPSRRPHRDGPMRELESNLGVLLVDYFRFYGRQLDYAAVGVSCNDGGRCYKKRATFPPPTKWRGRSTDRFSIMDPLDSKNDVAGGSFGSGAVRAAFDHAYQMLTYQPSNLRTMSAVELRAMRGAPLLGSILRLDEVLAIRPPPRREPAASGDRASRKKRRREERGSRRERQASRAAGGGSSGGSRSGGGSGSNGGGRSGKRGGPKMY
eukprot:jgi/Ulvmu1/11386/UM075_0048.1